MNCVHMAVFLCVEFVLEWEGMIGDQIYSRYSVISSSDSFGAI